MAEADGLSLNEWLTRTFGHRISWFQRRANAVAKLGEASRRVLDHNAAVWLADAVPAMQTERVMTAICRTWVAQHNIPVALRIGYWSTLGQNGKH